MDNLFKICLELIYHKTWFVHNFFLDHYSNVIMGTTASQITSLTVAYSTVYTGADQRKHGEFLAQMASNAEIVFIWLRHHDEKSLWNFVQSTAVTEDVESERDFTRVPLILDSSVGLSAGIQSAGDLVSETLMGSNPAFSRGRQLVSFRFEYRLPVPEHRN